MAETPRCTRRLAAMDGVTPEHQCYLAAGHEGRHEHFATTEGVAGIRYTWPDNRSCAGLPAPAAPSVGEPEPPRWTNAAGQCKACDDDGSPCEICKPGSNLDAAEAEIAALRSSLEEARKDSERLRAALDQARQALQSLASPTRFNLSPLIDPTTELRVRREFAEIGRAAATSALTPPRAPSPRDEP